MNILYVTSECYPFMTIGESGYVAHSLPKHLAENSELDVRVVLPNFSSISEEFKSRMKHVGKSTLKLSWRTIEFSVEMAVIGGIKHYFISNDYYFNRERAYGHHDDGERFAFFSKAVLASLEIIKFKPDLIHCNNTPASLIPLYLKELKEEKLEKGKINKFKNIKTLYTIHSLKYHGLIHIDHVENILGISSDDYFSDSKLKYHDYISFLKAGVLYADMVSTVSSTFMKELFTKEVAGDLADFFLAHKKKFVAIKNGIDYSSFDPKSDKEIYKNFGVSNFSNRVQNKLALQEELGLSIDASIPVIAVLSKLDHERGVELLVEKLEDIIREGAQIIIIGNGEERFEDFFDYYSYIYPNQVFSNSFDFSDHSISKRVLSGVDFILTPSKVEPCGLIQMLSLRYGAVPISRATGGAVETLNSENSFLFSNFSSDEMLDAIKKAIQTYRHDPTILSNLITKGMRGMNSWTTPTKKYIDVYNKIVL